MSESESSFAICSHFTCWVKCEQIASEITMNSPCTHWVIDPSPPVSWSTLQLDMDANKSEQASTQPLLNPQTSAAEVEREHSLNEVTGGSCPPPQSAAEPLCEPMESTKAMAERLVVHEQMHWEMTKILEHEEGKLNERRKRVGGSTTKSKKLVQDTFELNALKQFNNLRIEYHQKKAKNPNLKLCPSLEASTTVARQLGKSDYYAQRLREKLTYLHQVGELQTLKQGKGAVHQSLLSELQVAAAIQTWVKGAIPVEKGGYIRRVWLPKSMVTIC